MEFNLTAPCSNCPFRTDIKGYLTKGRVEEIIYGLIHQDSTFTCHKTNECTEDDEPVETIKSEHCAGALIYLERMNKPNQLMRISERMHWYDRTKLKMDSPVFSEAKDMIAAQGY